MKQNKHYLLFIAYIFLPHFIFSQESISSEENEIAEPLFRDNTTDIGSESGSIELNLVSIWQSAAGFDGLENGVEIEYTLKEGIGLEAELSHQSTWLADDGNDNNWNNVELGLQYTLWQKTKTALAVGLEVEAPLFNDANDWALAPFATYALLWSDAWSSQFGVSPEFELASEAELELGYQASLLYAFKNGLAGFELIGNYEDEWLLAFAPQITWHWGDFSIGSGIQLPIINGKSKEMGVLLRLIYEIEED